MSQTNIGNEKERLKFLSKIKSRGRPKFTKTGKLQFPKHKETKNKIQRERKTETKSKIMEKTATTEYLSESTVEILDDSDDDKGMPKSTGEVQVCGSPRVPGQIGDNIVTKQDYASLTKGTYVADGIINYMIRELDVNVVQRNENGKKSCLILSTWFYQRLIVWNKDQPLESKNLLDWEGLDSLWEDGAR